MYPEYRHSNTHCVLTIYDSAPRLAVAAPLGTNKNRHSAVCSVQCAVCSVQCAEQCAVCSVQCAVCSVQCAVCSVQFAVCSLQCAVCSAVWSNRSFCGSETELGLGWNNHNSNLHRHHSLPGIVAVVLNRRSFIFFVLISSRVKFEANYPGPKMDFEENEQLENLKTKNLTSPM